MLRLGLRILAWLVQGSRSPTSSGSERFPCQRPKPRRKEARRIACEFHPAASGPQVARREFPNHWVGTPLLVPVPRAPADQLAVRRRPPSETRASRTALKGPHGMPGQTTAQPSTSRLVAGSSPARNRQPCCRTLHALRMRALPKAAPVETALAEAAGSDQLTACRSR